MKYFPLFLTILFLGSATSINAEEITSRTADMIAPVVIHFPTSSTFSSEQGLTIEATVTDNVALHRVELFYRPIGETEYKIVAMNSLGQDNYNVILTNSQAYEPGIEYYIQAKDLSGNSLLHGYSYLPLVASIVTDTNGESIVTFNTKQADNVDKSLASSSSGSHFLKNKWLWIGLGVVAAAVISENSSGDDESTKPGYSVTVDAAPPTSP